MLSDILTYVKIKKSIFTPSISVVYVDDSDDEYQKLSKMFKMHGYAFIANSVIFFDVVNLKKDGWFKKEYLQFIESHEIAHKVLKHRDGPRSKRQEGEADFLGIRLCQDKGLDLAANVGIKHFADRNSIAFDVYQKKYGKKVLNSV